MKAILITLLVSVLLVLEWFGFRPPFAAHQQIVLSPAYIVSALAIAVGVDLVRWRARTQRSF